ncbi:MAG TPA: class I SAM-dependent methyltransferase [Vicinamibacterales bacterium]|nr:class I SAM-dependent methyltransferase [Vicinamibacterales bacterium]
MSSTKVSSAQSQTWCAEGYAQHAAFVPALGAPLIDRLNPRPGERILDLGCGDGTLTMQIAARGCTVIGVDASADMIAAAQRRGLDARLINAEHLPFDAEFDGVFSNAVLHWIKNADAVIAGVRTALKPGGRFVGEFGGHTNIAAISVALRAVLPKYGIDAPSDWFYPSVADYSSRLERGGFVVDDIALVPRPTPLATGMSGWLETFRGTILNALPADRRDAAKRELIELLAPSLCDDQGNWTADYVRLRFVAHV